MKLIKDSFYFNPFQAHRLVTHEDGRFMHLHKIFGTLSLGNFVYRLYMVARYKTMFFDSSLWTAFWIFVHTMMHVTSFEFILPNRRNKTYNIIWPEMRWHSLIFAYRSIVMMVAIWLSWNGYISQDVSVYLRGPVVILTMVLADMTTTYYKVNNAIKEDETTMRTNPYPNYVSSSISRVYNLFYSTSQVFATANILYRDINAMFLIIFAIQIAPFAMTLVKKGIINQAGWHWWYSIAIWSSYWYAIITPNDATYVYYHTSVVAFCVCRFLLRMNKYMLWSAAIALQWYMFATNPDVYNAVARHSIE